LIRPSAIGGAALGLLKKLATPLTVLIRPSVIGKLALGLSKQLAMAAHSPIRAIQQDRVAQIFKL
jgi:hypothetical protein